MGYRINFYSLTNNDIEDIAKGKCFYEYRELLCMELNPAICNIWDTCQPLFDNAESSFEAENPCIITKAKLKEICLAYYKEFQKYIIRQSTSLIYDHDVEKAIQDPKSLFQRCLHFEDGPDTDNARFNGLYMLHQLFLVHCSNSGEKINSKEFEKLLDSPKLTNGDTMYDILMQLVYMYKTYDENKILVIAGW